MAVSKAEADPRVLIREGDMSSFQVIVVTLCVLICALDGFDVLVVAFTAAAIAKDFDLDPTGLGILFSAGIAGMGFGALFIGPMGDKIGRRTTVLLCLVILCSGMLISSVTRDVTELALMRFYTGLGIGGVLANINIVVAEYASNRRRNLSISLM
jgi:MFS family permease